MEEYNIDTNIHCNIEELNNELRDFIDNPTDLDNIVSQIPIGVSDLGRRIEYLIISSKDMIENFKPLADWKRKKGIPSYIMSVEEIRAKYQGRDLQEQIKHCIYHLYLEYGLKYILLGGDDTIVPVRYCQRISEEVIPENRYPTDLYYSCFDKNFQWDANEDGIFGTAQDNISPNIDVYLTRLPIRTKEDVDNYV